MDEININTKEGVFLKNINKINILMGKNGCGKSIILRDIDYSHLHYEVTLKNQLGNVIYITPERGGFLKYNPNVDSHGREAIANSKRTNQYVNFKEQSISQYRKLENLILREIEENKNSLRDKHDYNFNSEVISEINNLLDNIKIQREESDFKILRKTDNCAILPNNISSGESELIALSIECLLSQKECIENKNNLLLLDEPDLHLHPDLQNRFAKFLITLVEKGNLNIIIATHSTAILGGFNNYNNLSIEFMRNGQKEIIFRKADNIIKEIFPIFGAHPLSNIFISAPIFIVEGEDDKRVWQQAIQTSEGKIKIFPCSVDEIGNMKKYESQILKILKSIYEEFVAYSLRDRDDKNEEPQDEGCLTRLMLSCRTAENLLLTDEVLKYIGLDWDDLKSKIGEWLEKNKNHQHFKNMSDFKNSGFIRKNFDLKKIRNDLLGIMESDKSWEIIVGKVIGGFKKPTNWEDINENSIFSYLGEKLVNKILPD